MQIARTELFKKDYLRLAPPIRKAAAKQIASAVSLAASFTVLFAVTWWTGKDGGDDLDDDVAAVMEL